MHVIFDEPDRAAAFANSRRGVDRLLDNSRHIYTNWEPIMAQRSFHPRMNPWRWANRKIEYSPDMCSKTLEILSRSCRIALGQQYPEMLIRRIAKGHADWGVNSA